MRTLSRSPGVALCLALAGEGHALGHSPGVWERAADPMLDANDQTHREVQALLMEIVPTPGDYWDSAQGQEQLRNALQKLEEAHADTAPDVRLRFDLGEVLYELKDDYARCARRAGERARPKRRIIRMATHAYLMLGICYAKLQEPAKEVVCYEEYLRRDSSTSGRALAFSNRAEARDAASPDAAGDRRLPRRTWRSTPTRRSRTGVWPWPSTGPEILRAPWSRRRPR